MLRIVVSLWHVRSSLFSKESKWLMCADDLYSRYDFETCDLSRRLIPRVQSPQESIWNFLTSCSLDFKASKVQLLQRCFCWHETQPKLLLEPEVGRAEKPCTSSHLCVSQECSTQIRLRFIVWEAEIWEAHFIWTSVFRNKAGRSTSCSFDS